MDRERSKKGPRNSCRSSVRSGWILKRKEKEKTLGTPQLGKGMWLTAHDFLGTKALCLYKGLTVTKEGPYTIFF